MTNDFTIDTISHSVRLRFDYILLPSHTGDFTVLGCSERFSYLIFCMEYEVVSFINSVAEKQCDIFR